MEALNLEPTTSTPAVHFDHLSGNIEIKGESRPENVRSFYDPLLSWLDGYLKDRIASGVKEPVRFKCFLEYFNSSSAKYLLFILKKLTGFVAAGIPVEVEWCYTEDDDDMKETGEEMEKMSKIKFSYTVV
jgi:hypothetical protein